MLEGENHRTGGLVERRVDDATQLRSSLRVEDLGSALARGEVGDGSRHVSGSDHDRDGIRRGRVDQIDVLVGLGGRAVGVVVTDHRGFAESDALARAVAFGVDGTVDPHQRLRLGGHVDGVARLDGSIGLRAQRDGESGTPVPRGEREHQRSIALRDEAGAGKLQIRAGRTVAEVLGGDSHRHRLRSGQLVRELGDERVGDGLVFHDVDRVVDGDEKHRRRGTGAGDRLRTRLEHGIGRSDQGVVGDDQGSRHAHDALQRRVPEQELGAVEEETDFAPGRSVLARERHIGERNAHGGSRSGLDGVAQIDAVLAVENDRITSVGEDARRGHDRGVLDLHGQGSHQARVRRNRTADGPYDRRIEVGELVAFAQTIGLGRILGVSQSLDDHVLDDIPVRARERERDRRADLRSRRESDARVSASAIGVRKLGSGDGDENRLVARQRLGQTHVEGVVDGRNGFAFGGLEQRIDDGVTRLVDEEHL